MCLESGSLLCAVLEALQTFLNSTILRNQTPGNSPSPGWDLGHIENYCAFADFTSSPGPFLCSQQPSNGHPYPALLAHPEPEGV